MLWVNPERSVYVDATQVGVLCVEEPLLVLKGKPKDAQSFPAAVIARKRGLFEP